LQRAYNFPRGFFTPMLETVPVATNPDLITMGRPKKDSTELRSRWAVLNVTPSERAAIEAYARAAGLSTSSYIVQRALQRPVSPRQDRQRIIRQQARLMRYLEGIAAAFVTGEPVRDAGAALLTLRRIEAEITAWNAGGGMAPEEGDAQ
jgi:uncharacterized protein (DUF1778 family)